MERAKFADKLARRGHHMRDAARLMVKVFAVVFGAGSAVVVLLYLLLGGIIFMSASSGQIKLLADQIRRHLSKRTAQSQLPTLSQTPNSIAALHNLASMALGKNTARS